MNTSTGVVSFIGNSTYGLIEQTDSHMMKNNEWGAVAHLSHSQYGINKEIRINNYWASSKTLTGCGATSANAKESNSCGIPYGSPSTEIDTYPQSITGNITGVFDMSGGAWEKVMGVLADSTGNPRSGKDTTYNSGFNGALLSVKYTAGISFPDNKYYNLYTVTSSSSCTLSECGGHALNETSSWYSDTVNFVLSDGPWFDRGGNYLDEVNAGAFRPLRSSGFGYSDISWRSILVAD